MKDPKTLHICTGQVPGGTRGYLKSMGFLRLNLLKELKRARKAKKNVENKEGNAEGENREADQTEIENPENVEAEIETIVDEADFMPGRTSSTKNRLQEFEALGMGQRSFVYESPYSNRTNGVTARVQASQDNREKQKQYDLSGKNCVDCGKGFRNGDALKSKVIKCTKCHGFVHEKIKGCQVNLVRGNQENFSCKKCKQQLETGKFNELLQNVNDLFVFYCIDHICLTQSYYRW